MLERILRHIKNWFVVSTHSGEYEIKQGSIALPFLLDGQYFRITGSVLNDGVYVYPATNLRDEAFVGEIWALSIPKDLIDLESEIKEWEKTNGASAAGPYASESFGGYTYTKATNANQTGFSWQDAFRGRLNIWRKV